MFKGESSDIMRYLETVNRDRRLKVIILGPDGRPAFGTEADVSKQPPAGGEKSSIQGNELVFHKTLYNEKKCHFCHNPQDSIRGSIIIKHSMDKVEKGIRQTALQILLFALFLGFTSEIFLMIVMRKSILRPLETLNKGAQILRDGKLRHRIPLTRQDEIGALADCFNEMAESIEKSHAHLESAVRQKTTELRVIAELSTSVFKGDLGFDSIARHFLTAIKDRMGFDYSAVCLVDRETGRLSPEFNTGIKGKLCIEGISVGSDHPFVRCIRDAATSVKRSEEIGAPGIAGNAVVVPILSHQRKRCREINSCSFENCPAFSSADERCWLLPDTLCRSPKAVAGNGKIYGCIVCPAFPVFGVLIAGRKGEITKSSLHSLEILASELASAIENQRLIESKKADINKLINLHDLSVDAIEGLGSSFPKSISYSAAILSNSNAAVLWLKDRDGKLYPEEYFNIDREQIPQSLESGGIVGAAIALERITETLNTDEEDGLKDLARAGGFLYIAAVPLKFKDEMIGCLTLFKDRDFLMSLSERAILFLFASQAAAAINSARIYRALKESEERHRGFIESANDAIFTIATDGAILSLNPAFETITGWERSEWLGRQFSGLVHPDDLPTGNEMFSRAMAEGIGSPFEMRIRHRAGEYLTGEFTEVPFFQDGKIIGVFGIARDISARKKADESLRTLMYQLKAQKEFSDAIFNNTSTGIMALDREGRLIRINKAGSEILGITPEKALGRRSAEIYPALSKVVFVDQNINREVTVITENGVEKPIGFSTSALVDFEGKVMGTVVVFRDLAEIKKLQQELRNKEHFQAIGKVISGVAHEVRNPLFGISSIGQILEKELDLPQHKTLIAAMLKETGRMRRLIDELLLYTRPARLDIREVDLAALLGEMNQYAAARNEKINLSLHTAANLTMKGDRDKIMQVLLNLANNAIDAANRTILVSSGETPEGKIEVTFTDDGAGIKPEDMEKIFDPFFTTKKGGTGLGLPICKKIIEDHGGEIEVRSASGGGTTVILRFPRN